MTDKSTQKRASRYIRLTPPPSIALTARDKQVVRLVNDYRVIRQEHIEKLLFPSKNTAQKRLCYSGKTALSNVNFFRCSVVYKTALFSTWWIEKVLTCCKPSSAMNATSCAGSLTLLASSFSGILSA